MKIKSFLQLIILFFFALGIYAAAALTPPQAEQWAQNKGQEILQILSDKNNTDKYEQLDQILNEDIDLDFAAKFVLGKYWRQMTDAQKELYVPLFKRYVAALYKSVPLNIDSDDIHFTIDKTVETPKGMEVWCTILIKKIEQAVDQPSKGGIKVLFTLVENNNHIQVRDLKIEESSLLISYRDRFYKMIHQDSDDELEWFLEDFEALVQDTEQKNEEKLERL